MTSNENHNTPVNPIRLKFTYLITRKSFTLFSLPRSGIQFFSSKSANNQIKWKQTKNTFCGNLRFEIVLIRNDIFFVCFEKLKELEMFQETLEMSLHSFPTASNNLKIRPLLLWGEINDVKLQFYEKIGQLTVENKLKLRCFCIYQNINVSGIKTTWKAEGIWLKPLKVNLTPAECTKWVLLKFPPCFQKHPQDASWKHVVTPPGNG